MGIQIEFNTELALRKYGTPGRLEAECLPSHLKEGEGYEFLKEGQRNYLFDREIPLVETKGNGRFSKRLASVRILAARHHLRNEKVWTDGIYAVCKVYHSKEGR